MQAIAVQMGFPNGLAFERPKLIAFVSLLYTLTITLGRVASDDQTGVPAAGLLCISDCSTCPVICSPPPPPKESSYPPLSPPSVYHSPPQSYYHSPPPPQPPPPPPQPSPPWSTYPPTSTPPPPPPFKYNNPPPSPVQARAPPTAGTGPNNYPYPYYYFYASEASPLSRHASFSSILVFLCFTVLLCYTT